MRYIWKSFLFFILLSFISSPLTAEKGVIDLRAFDLTVETVDLEGEWEFYWEQVLYPGDSFPSGKVYQTVPEEWGRSDEYESLGYGTYKVTVLMPSGQERMALYIPSSFNQYRIFANGSLWAENGDVSESHSVNVNRKGPFILFLPEEEEIELIYQISNFDDLHGGILTAPRIGSYVNLKRVRDQATIFESFLFGALLITGLLYLSFYINKRDDGSSLYFGLFSVVLALRTILYGEHILLQIFTNLSVELEAAMGHITFYLAVPLFLRFITMAYPMSILKKIRIPVNIISGAYILLALFTHHRVYVQFLAGYQAVAVIVGLGIIICLVMQAIRGNQSAHVTLIGFFALLMAAVNDILHSQEIIHTFHSAPIGVAFFIMSQASLLSWNIGRAFRKSEELASELTIANNSFRRFVPEEFLKFLKKEKVADIQLGDHVQLDMTVLFCDIRDFTSMSENMTPHENFLFLNSFLERIGPVIRRNNGFVDKYIGDGVMALFPGDADSAVQAALDIQETLALYNSHRSNSGYSGIRIGIGINTGSLMLGTIGENERMDSTVISDAVNVCSRIESITKEYGLNIAMSENTYKLLTLKDKLKIRNIGRVILKGKKEPVPVYELYNCDNPEIVKKKDDMRDQFENAVELYEKKKYEEALKDFSRMLDLFPEDETCERYRNNIFQYLTNLVE